MFDSIYFWLFMIIISPAIIYIVGKMLSAGIMEGYYSIRKKYDKGDTR